MSVMPFQPSPLSPRDFGLQLLASQINRDPSDVSIGANVAGALGAHTVTSIKDAMSEGAVTLVECLSKLGDQGGQTEVGKALVRDHGELNKVLIDIAAAIGRTIDKR